MKFDLDKEALAAAGQLVNEANLKEGQDYNVKLGRTIIHPTGWEKIGKVLLKAESKKRGGKNVSE